MHSPDWLRWCRNLSHPFHTGLVRLRSSRQSTISPLALEHLDFIYVAYTFYTGLLEEPSLKFFCTGWLEALGDLSHYCMAVAATSFLVILLQAVSLRRMLPLLIMSPTLQRASRRSAWGPPPIRQQCTLTTRPPQASASSPHAWCRSSLKRNAGRVSPKSGTLTASQTHPVQASFATTLASVTKLKPRSYGQSNISWKGLWPSASVQLSLTTSVRQHDHSPPILDITRIHFSHMVIDSPVRSVSTIHDGYRTLCPPPWNALHQHPTRRFCSHSFLLSQTPRNPHLCKHTPHRCCQTPQFLSNYLRHSNTQHSPYF